jgi:hypothetical protein
MNYYTQNKFFLIVTILAVGIQQLYTQESPTVPQTTAGNMPSHIAPGALASKPREPLTNDQVAAHLLSLIQRFSDFSSYEFYLLAIPIREDQLAAGYEPESGKRWFPIKQVTDAGKGILFTRPKDLWKNDAPIFDGEDVRGVSRFVTLNDADISVPIGVAKGLADSFLAGLIAKIYSHGLLEILLDPGDKIERDASGEFTFPLTHAKMEGGLKALSPKQLELLRDFSKPATYGKLPAAGLIPKSEWEPNFAKKQQGLSLKASGMLKGWEAGCRMLDLAPADREEVVKSILALVHNRLTPRQCAKITAYTITYLEGWARGITELNQPGQKSVTEAEQVKSILEALAQPQAPLEGRTLADLMYEKLLLVTTGLTASAARANDQERPAASTAAAEFSECLQGFREGANTAVGVLFADAYKLGFEAGYQRGFRDGYSAGFAAAKSSVNPQDDDRVARNIRGIFNGSKPTLAGVISAAKDIATIWSGDMSPIRKQVDKATNWVRKTFGF